MYRVTRTEELTSIQIGSAFVRIGAIVFLAIGAFDLVAAFVSGHPGELLAPGIICLAVGVLYGFVPYRTVLVVEPTKGTFVRMAYALFRSNLERGKLDELESVVIIPSTYYWSFAAMHTDGGQTRLFGQLKNTWAWNRTPSDDIVARGQEVAGLLGVPLKNSQELKLSS